jgi:hypothetical protein
MLVVSGAMKAYDLALYLLPIFAGTSSLARKMVCAKRQRKAERKSREMVSVEGALLERPSKRGASPRRRAQAWRRLVIRRRKRKRILCRVASACRGSSGVDFAAAQKTRGPKPR